MLHNTMKLLHLLVISLLLSGISCQGEEERREEAVEKSSETVTNLYLTLRNIVFPDKPLNNEVTSNRFVMSMPGKVLSYLDYYPGKEYESSLIQPDSSKTSAPIPPAVMEKWFDLADVMVGGSIYSGAETGKSMAVTYETILKQMQILGIDTKTASIQATYNMANQYLNGEVPDPDDSSKSVTRLNLYYRYQTDYADRKLQVEERINNARLTKTAVEYELWFQRHYPSLNAKLESEYLKWVAFGNKEQVEVHLSYLDSASAGVMVEDARMSLRASGTLSLDRTRTVYPVSFVPSNWYKYLLPKAKPQSKDMVLAQMGKAQTAKDALLNMIDYNSNITDPNSLLQGLQDKVDAAVQTREGTTQNATSLLIQCLRQQDSDKTVSNDDDPCKKSDEANEATVGATFEQAAVQYRHGSTAFVLNKNNKYNSFLQTRVDNLDDELDNIKLELDSAEHNFDDAVLDSDNQKDEVASITDDKVTLDDAWTKFEYDSESSYITTDKHVTAHNTASSIGLYLTDNIGLGLAIQKGKATADLKQAINAASTKVSGELLRVSIKRPWFKPELFEDPSLSFVQSDDINNVNTYVSPGPLTESGLQAAIGGLNSNRYLLPEYVTSILLARNVKLEFFGIDSNTVSHGMQALSGVSFSASFGFFDLKAAVDDQGKKQHVTIDKTTTGISLTIPGAQIIGYYTNVLPKFPAVQFNSQNF